ncbi:MAG: hypothetical protein E7360_00450 [Clostridiales bacterium]|nr:hypothetical protein [Clostridiales bacterium]
MALKILSKGKYAENQSSLPITVKQYIFADKDGKKQLYLRVKNERGETVTGVKYAIVQINARGQEIATTQVAFTNLKGVAGSLLSLNKPIEVRKECVDFKAYLISANYGNYVYSIRKSNAHLTYKEEVNRKKLATYQVNEKVGAKGRKINVIKIKAPLVGLFTTIALICVVAFMTLTGIEEFKQENRGFTLKGLEYRIESFEDKTVYVSGYFGESSKVYLADKVEDYTILGVDDYAFEDNETIKEVQIIGNLAVSKGAFKDCRRLLFAKRFKFT